MEHRSTELAERRSTLTFLAPRDERPAGGRSSNERARRYTDSEPGGSGESAYSDPQGLRRVRSWLRGLASLPSSFGSDTSVRGVRRNRMALLIACGYHDSPHESMKLKNSWKDIRTMQMLLLSQLINSPKLPGPHLILLRKRMETRRNHCPRRLSINQ
jgi:hypothetical protein